MPNPQTAVFPYAASGDLNLTVASDNAQTTLNGGINNSVTTIVVTSSNSFIAPCLIVIGGEIILAGTISDDVTFENCVRGFAGTAAASHTDTAPVYGYIVSYLHNQVAAEINSMSSVLFYANYSGLKTSENLLLWSQALETGSSWSLASGATIPATNGTSPINDSTARTLLEGNSLGLNSVSSAFSNPTVAAYYVFSVYAQYTNNQWLTVGQNIVGDTTRRVSFDIQNGLVGIQGSAATGSIVPVGNGWYRCLVLTNCTSNSNKNFDIVISSANNVVSYLGTTTQSVMLWGAQVQLGNFSGPLTYVPTTGAIVLIQGGGDLILDEGDLT